MTLGKKIFLYASFIAILLPLLIMAYWLFYPYKVVELKEPMKILTPRVESGGFLRYEVDYCKFMDLPALTSRQLIDTQIIFLPGMQTNNPVGCLKSERSLQLPKGIYPNTYVLRITNTYQINPLRRESYTWETEPFEVVSLNN